jgi:hypothetical protein
MVTSAPGAGWSDYQRSPNGEGAAEANVAVLTMVPCVLGSAGAGTLIPAHRLATMLPVVPLATASELRCTHPISMP